MPKSTLVRPPAVVSQASLRPVAAACVLLIGAATVFRTPNASLIAQGLPGTVNLMARRPLDTRGREVAVNVRAETNALGTEVPGVVSPKGNRVSLTCVNRFADNTLGVALGFAHLKSTTQSRSTELDRGSRPR